MRKAVAVLLFELLGFGGCGDPDTSNWSKEKIIKAIETGRTPKIKCAALWQVSVSFSHWDLSTKQRNRLFNVLIQSLKDEGSWVRESAAKALGRIKPNAKEAVPALTQALEDEDGDVRNSASEALKRINIEAETTEDINFDF